MPTTQSFNAGLAICGLKPGDAPRLIPSEVRRICDCMDDKTWDEFRTAFVEFHQVVNTCDKAERQAFANYVLDAGCGVQRFLFAMSFVQQGLSLRTVTVNEIQTISSLIRKESWEMCQERLKDYTPDRRGVQALPTEPEIIKVTLELISLKEIAKGTPVSWTQDFCVHTGTRTDHYTASSSSTIAAEARAKVSWGLVGADADANYNQRRTASFQAAATSTHQWVKMKEVHTVTAADLKDNGFYWYQAIMRVDMSDGPPLMFHGPTLMTPTPVLETLFVGFSV